MPTFGRPTIAILWHGGGCRGFVGGGEQSVHRIEQFGHAEAMLRRDGIQLLHAKLIEVRNQRLHLRRINLVDGHQQRLRRPAQQADDFQVLRHQTGPAVHQQHQDIGFGNRQFGLAFDQGHHAFRGGRFQPSRIDKPKRPVPVIGLRIVPISCDARHVVDDRRFLSQNAVEQGRFTDIRPADDGNGGRGAENSIGSVDGEDIRSRSKPWVGTVT